MAIRGTLGHHFARDDAVSARTILDNDLLLERFRDFGANEPCLRVIGTSRLVANQHADGLVRKCARLTQRAACKGAARQDEEHELKK